MIYLESELTFTIIGPGASKAIAVITSTSSSNVSGIVTFEQVLSFL